MRNVSHHSLLSVAQLQELHIHSMLSFMLSVLSAYTQKLSFVYVWATLKKGVAKTKKQQLMYVLHKLLIINIFGNIRNLQ